MPPVIDESGRVTFTGSRQRAENSYAARAIFRWKPSVVSILVEPGMKVYDGSLYSVAPKDTDGGDNHYFSINAAGDVAFFGQQSNNGPYNLYVKGASLRTIARGNTAAPGGGLYQSMHTAVLADSGLVAFKAGIAADGSQHCYYLSSGSTTSRLLKPGDTLPGGGVLQDRYGVVGPIVNSVGQIAFHFGNGTENGVYLIHGLSFTKIQGGDVYGYSRRMINNAGDISFAGQEGNIFLYRDGVTTEIAGPGSIVVNGDPLYVTEIAPSLNNKGEVAFVATENGGDYKLGMYRWTEGEIFRIVQEGDTAPVTEDGIGGVFETFGRPVINDRGELTFMAMVNGAWHLYFWNGTLHKVVGPGAVLNGKVVEQVSIAEIGPHPSHRALNNQGQIPYMVTFSDYSEGVFLYTPAPVAPVFEGPMVADAVIGRAFSFKLFADRQPTSYVVTGLPAGLKVNAATGVISGAPKQTGTFQLQVTATNEGGSDTTTLDLTIADLSAYKGIYAGSVQGAPNTNDKAGWASFTLSATGTGTLALQFGGQKFSVKLLFDSEGRFTATLPKTMLVLKLAIDKVNGTDQITGTVEAGGPPIITMALDRKQTTYTTKNPIPRAGYYTVSLPPDPNHLEASFPQGAGYIGLTVSPTGAVRLAGALADGSKVSLGLALSKASEFSFYLPLYKYAGSFTGRATVLAAGPNPVNGTVSWFRPGVAAEIGLVSSLYLPPTKANPAALNLPDGEGAFAVTGGDVLTTPANKELTIDNTSNKVKIVGAEKFTMTIAAKTGLFSGTFYDTAGKARKFYGILLQDQNLGRGYFKGLNQFGHVAFDPAP